MKEKTKKSHTLHASCFTPKGFTLVEVLVSTAIFAMIMLLATGAILTIVDSNKKAHALKSVITNLNFALESMSRDMRVGGNFACKDGNDDDSTSGETVNADDSCPEGNDGFEFVASRDSDADGDGDTVMYSFNNGAIYREHFCELPQPGCDSGPGFGGPVRITANEVVIDDMVFYVTGTNPTDTLQPRVLITISGKVGVGKTISRFDIQTFVSQRSRY